MADTNTTKHKPRIGIALGSGSARGWAHIGVLRALAELGIQPEIIAGCSIGSIVGAAYAAGNLDLLEKEVLSFNKLDLVRFFDLNPSFNGFVHRERLQQFFNDYVCPTEQTFAQLPNKFATVATYLGSGREMWFTEGKVADGIMASISLPGLFAPFSYQDQWLVDGGLVNPVPVSLCRALGADIVIAVNLNGAITRRHFQPPVDLAPKTTDLAVVPENDSAKRSLSNVAASLRDYSASLFNPNRLMPAPNLIEAIAGSINIMQDKITRSRMAGDPPEILLAPKLADIGLLEFYRAQEAINAGRDAVQRLRFEIEAALSA
ncbi:patatin-like phospholipase RssA [uncultured Thiothrix sp.]|uniref:patatin-like phospholipase RssA n=1 Tax=uncultured Thiothrix sp. TaxID=223185 RepID=UPI00261B13EC|nr:patatin-like phospholipase RssA [uncultured Thiothrix sp.]